MNRKKVGVALATVAVIGLGASVAFGVVPITVSLDGAEFQIGAADITDETACQGVDDILVSFSPPAPQYVGGTYVEGELMLTVDGFVPACDGKSAHIALDDGTNVAELVDPITGGTTTQFAAGPIDVATFNNQAGGDDLTSFDALQRLSIAITD